MPNHIAGDAGASMATIADHETVSFTETFLDRFATLVATMLKAVAGEMSV